MPLPQLRSKGAPTKRFATLAALRRLAIKRAVGIAAVSQGVMVFLMIPTPIAMVGCGLREDTASDVVRWHIEAMFAPSFFTGFLIKRFGAQTIAMSGLVMIAVAIVAAAMGISAMHFYSSLIILGLGWNLGFIGATTMLDAAVPETEKAAVQGVNDTIIALVPTVCAFAAGLVVSTLGWAVLAMMSGGIVVLAVAILRSGRIDAVGT